MTVSFDRVAEIFDRTRAFPEPVMRKLHTTLTNELSEYRAVLNAGVGTGRFAKPLQDSGFEVIGVDIARKMLEKAAEKGVGSLFLGDICSLHFKDKSFDATVCTSVLHLITEWRTALQEICRVTQEVMVSRYYAHKNPMREATSRLVKRFGYESRLGKAEWELRSLVRSSRAVFAAFYEMKADEILTHLSQKAYSYQ